jgi:aryl-alcohol dehydrogenase-like predicted oxidoreductase
LDTCRRLGIGFVAYSPLGRGFLTENPEVHAEPGEGDFAGSNHDSVVKTVRSTRLTLIGWEPSLNVEA